LDQWEQQDQRDQLVLKDTQEVLVQQGLLVSQENQAK